MLFEPISMYVHYLSWTKGPTKRTGTIRDIMYALGRPIINKPFICLLYNNSYKFQI